MFIMHTHMIGKVTSDPVIVKDKNVGDLYCTYSILVKEEGQLIPFTVYVSDKKQINLCRDRLVRDSMVFINGIIEISFHNIRIPGAHPYPVITSNMTLISKELCIISGQNGKPYTITKNAMLPIVASSQQSQRNNDLIPDELPF